MTKRILVVEDHDDNRRILEDLPSSVGFEVIHVADGAAAVVVAGRERPDLILTDIQLPIMDGYEATRRIKANPACARIPIIAVTSYALSGDDPSRNRLRQCGGSLPPRGRGSPCRLAVLFRAQTPRFDGAQIKLGQPTDRRSVSYAPQRHG